MVCLCLTLSRARAHTSISSLLLVVFVNVLQAYVSLKRIDKFLAEEETHKYTVLSESASEDDPKVGFVDAAFTWASEDVARADPSVFRVSGLDFAFPEESLSIILGPGEDHLEMQSLPRSLN